MTTYGLTPTGFVPKTLTVVRADLDAAMRAALGQSLILGDRTTLGIINGIMAERYAEVWALAQAVYNSQDPNAAVGLALDNLSALTGTLRPVPQYSIVTLTFTGTPGSIAPINTIVATASTSVPFQSTENVTLVSLPAWVPSTAYLVGARVTNAGHCFQCGVAGVSAGSVGPHQPVAPTPIVYGTNITDGGVTWHWMGAGTAVADVIARSQDTGKKAASLGDLTVITTPASGVTGAVNVLDATLGRDLGSDQELRLLREAELSGDGVSTADAIRASLLKVSGVEAVTLFHNDTDTTDSNGLPPHSVEALVLGGADQDIADTLFAEVAAGIATYSFAGTFTPVTDSQGVSHNVYFTRPSSVQISVKITLTYDVTSYPSDGDAEVQLAIAKFGQTFSTGRDVTVSGCAAQGFQVDGVLDVTDCRISTSYPATGTTTITITARQLASFDISRIDVISSPATP